MFVHHFNPKALANEFGSTYVYKLHFVYFSSIWDSKLTRVLIASGMIKSYLRMIILLILITSDITTQGTAPIPAEKDAMYSWQQRIIVRQHKGKNREVMFTETNLSG